ncbi:MAG: glycosyltransferase family 39 protein [Pirellulales bacterium]
MRVDSKDDPTIVWFWILLLGHMILWTLLPILTQLNAPLDTIEMLYWGSEWQWGYYKHPPLPAWAAEGSALVFGDPVWPTYLLSQLCIGACFWAAWKMGREFLAPWQALAAVFLLEASVYYTCTTPEFNNNILAKACWALFALFAYWGMSRKHSGYWATSGVCLAAAMLSKYDAILLLMAVLLFSVLNRTARQSWKTPGPYVLTAVSLMLFAPHLWWLVDNDFVTIHYILSRTGDPPVLIDHLKNPLEFIGSQLGALALVLIMATMVLSWRWKIKPAESDASFHRQYLLFVVLGPMSIALLFSLLTGAHVRSMWGSSMFTYIGVLLFTWFETKPAIEANRRLVYACVGISMIFAVGLGIRNQIGSSLRKDPLRIDYPGEQLAQEVEQRWKQYQSSSSVSDANLSPLTHVGGDWWLSGNVHVYSKHRPTMYPDMDASIAPWTDDRQLAETGGMILWKMHEEEAYLAKLKQRFPEAVIQDPISLNWKKDPSREPLQIGIAVIPNRQ